MKLASLLIPATIIALSACGHKSSVQTEDDAVALTPAQQLLQRLQRIQATGKVMFGHHDSPCYGHLWQYEPGRSDIKDVCGDMPAVMSWDLGGIEHLDSLELDGVPFDFIRREAARHDSLGGINVFSWHLRNPATGGDAWDTSAGDIVSQMVAEGSPLNDTMQIWIGRAADYLSSLRRSDGSKLPVVFRPWHEHTGGWFFWGEPNTSPEAIKALWALTRRVFDQKGVDNVLWAYSPDRCTDGGLQTYLRSYPGDSLVDILGADVYHRVEMSPDQGLTAYKEATDSTLGAVVTLAKERGKIAAFTETGLDNVVDPRWFPDVLLPILKKYPVAYVCVWRNAMDKPQEYFAPYLGHPSAEPFKEFYADTTTLFLRDVARIK